MRDWCERTIPKLGSLRGYMLMAKSPSCGLERVRTDNGQGDVQRRDAAGIFARQLVGAYPILPVEEEGRLNDPNLRENFIEGVFVFDEWCRLVEVPLTPTKLIQYIRAFMAGMKRPAARGAHVNVMLHLLGFFRVQLESVERDAIEQSIQDYLHDQMP